MGYSNWDTTQYTAYAASTNYRSASRNEVFNNRLSPKLDPKNIIMRESRDSEFNPQSTPVIFSLDYTGSMGYIAEAIAKDDLPKLMERIYDEKPITDPHIMFMGFGDTRASDPVPFQMSQFEADIRIVEQLREMYLAGGGGGNDSESVIMSWYAANYLTDTDIVKREGCGFLFTISDECVPPNIDFGDLARVFGIERAGDMVVPQSNRALFDDVQKRYNTFHIIAEDGNYARTSTAGRTGALYQGWKDLMGANVIRMRKHTDLTEIVMTVFKTMKYNNIFTAIEESEQQDMLRYSFSAALESV